MALFRFFRKQLSPGHAGQDDARYFQQREVFHDAISFPRALGRTLAKVLSKALCYIGYIVALFTARNQALHDLLADTLVLEPDYASARAGEIPQADKEVEASIEDENSPAE